MSRTVWKFELAIEDEGTVVKLGAPKPVLVGLDPFGVQCVWIEHDTDSPVEIHRYHVHGTGHPIGDGETHVGSFVSGQFVWHVYTERDLTAEAVEFFRSPT